MFRRRLAAENWAALNAAIIRGVGGGPGRGVSSTTGARSGSAGPGAAASAGDARSLAGDLPRRHAGRRRVRARAGGQGRLRGYRSATPFGRCGRSCTTTGWRSRSARRWSLGIGGRFAGPLTAEATALLDLAAGRGVAAGAGRLRQAHAQAGPGMGPELGRVGAGPERCRGMTR